MNETRSVGKQPEVSEAAKVGPEQAGASATAGTVASTDAPPEVFEVNGAQTYRVTLPTFDGPLDLLLHLVQKHELDILDIPIGFVALKYVEYIRMMEELSIDIASEYLVMAATLAYIKSRSLLPPDPTQVEEEVPEDEEDPRTELIRRLLEYQKYKLAAEQLGERSVLGRDVFPRGAPIEASTDPAPLAPLSLFRLVDAFGDVLKRAKHVEEHTINFERISISDKIGSINELLSQKGSLRFEELFVDDRTRAEMIVTFLALLEMTKLRMVFLRQDDPLGPITIDLRVREQDDDEEPWLAAVRITSDSPSAAPVPAPIVEPELDEEFEDELGAGFDADESDEQASTEAESQAAASTGLDPEPMDDRAAGEEDELALGSAPTLAEPWLQAEESSAMDVEVTLIESEVTLIESEVTLLEPEATPPTQDVLGDPPAEEPRAASEPQHEWAPASEPDAAGALETSPVVPRGSADALEQADVFEPPPAEPPTTDAGDAAPVEPRDVETDEPGDEPLVADEAEPSLPSSENDSEDSLATPNEQELTDDEDRVG